MDFFFLKIILVKTWYKIYYEVLLAIFGFLKFRKIIQKAINIKFGCLLIIIISKNF